MFQKVRKVLMILLAGMVLLFSILYLCLLYTSRCV